MACFQKTRYQSLSIPLLILLLSHSLKFRISPIFSPFISLSSHLCFSALVTHTGGLVDGDKIEVLPERVERLASRLKVQYSAMPYYAMPCCTLLIYAWYHSIYPPVVPVNPILHPHPRPYPHSHPHWISSRPWRTPLPFHLLPLHFSFSALFF